MTGRMRSTPRRGPAGARGFTLIETIVVLTILGLALTIVAGFLPRRNTTLEVAEAASRVANAMRIARSRAIAESRPVPFAITRDGHGFLSDRGLVSLGPAVTAALLDRDSILFAPDGSATGGTIRVQVGNRSRLIRVDWLTGRVMVRDWPDPGAPAPGAS